MPPLDDERVFKGDLDEPRPPWLLPGGAGDLDEARLLLLLAEGVVFFAASRLEEEGVGALLAGDLLLARRFDEAAPEGEPPRISLGSVIRCCSIR